MLVSSEGITTQQKRSFSHTFLWDSVCFKQMKTTQFINSSFLLNNADNFLLKDNTIFQSQINERMI